MRERLAVYEELDISSNETLSAAHARRARFRCRLVMAVISPAYGHVPRNTKSQAQKTAPGQGVQTSGRYWIRTSDPFRVKEVRYRCANRPRALVARADRA